MTRRIISAILILLIVLPAVISAGGVLFAPKSPFSEFDANWENSLTDAIFGSGSEKIGQTPLPEGERYIVKFKDNVKAEEMKNALSETDYRPLAESKHKLFAVLPDETFFESYSEIIAYSEPDLLRGAYAVTNDPATVPSYRPLGINNVWDTVTGKSEVIVAVLDTGVEREHEDLKNANILPGYDAVGRKAGVYSDTVGHGTGVIGLIAATANNGKGIAGVAHGVSVLPIKVSSSGSTIYSSDLIAGIRFAADAGAKIINMSVGGYSSSVAEQEAVNYAISKGCILIAAAGNDGKRPYGNQKSYPASYDGVVSVASCNENGEPSDFSQRNEAVDVAAPGENIPMPFMEQGKSVYRYDSGTSYSCAFVSGIAALAVSYIDGGIRFDNAEFISVIIDSLGAEKTVELGHGMINAPSVISKVSEPIITGIVNGATYSKSVVIGFTRGTALLDGDPISDGDSVISNGSHVFELTDGDFKKVINFKLNYSPLSYKFKEFSEYSCFEFERGTAFLNGFPYKSGEKISASGKHVFELSDGDEKLSKTVYVQYKLPSVFGVADGQTYDKPINIVILGDGSATLDGKEVNGEVTVFENGKHTLILQSGNGALRKTINFNINFAEGKLINFDLANAQAAIDEENGFMVLYSDSLVGVRVYNLDSPEKYHHLLNTGCVYSHKFTETELILFGENGITVLDRKKIKEKENPIKKTDSAEGMDYYIYVEDKIYCFGNGSVFTFNPETSETELIKELGFDCERVYYSNGRFCLVPKENQSKLSFLNLDDLSAKTIEIGFSVKGLRICFDGNTVSAGKCVFNADNGKLLLEFSSNTTIAIENGKIFTEDNIIELESGKIIGCFPFPVANIVGTESGKYLFGFEKTFAKINSGADGVAQFGAAEKTNRVLSQSEQVTDYRKNAFYGINRTPLSVASSEKSIYVLFDNENSLHKITIDNLSEELSIPLKYVPDKVAAGSGYIAVSFKNASSVYLAKENDPENGNYINFPSSCSDIFVFNGRLYAVSEGRLAYKPLDGGNVAFSQINATEAVADENNIFALQNGVLSVYGKNHKFLANTQAEGNGIFTGNGVAVGKTLYKSANLNEALNLGSQVIAMNGNAVITKKGVYSISKEKYIGQVGVDPEIAFISKNNFAISLGKGILSICSNNGTDIGEIPNVEGIASGKIFVGSVTVNYPFGLGFVDGQPIKSGNSVNEAGEHIFALSLPFGNTEIIRFVIEAPVSGIKFLSPTRTMSVGETVILRLKYLPEGSASLPASFFCESDGLTIGENGEVTANKVGEYKVTAEVKSDHGTFTANCEITVRDDLITFPEESEFYVDRDREFVMGINPGTKVSEIKALFGKGKQVQIIRPDGKRATDYVATGHQIFLYTHDDITDVLTIVVNGDADGDGFVSAYDLHKVEQFLRGEKPALHFYAAADINKNGIVADNDYRTLRSALLKKSNLSLGTPDDNLYGYASAQTLSHIEKGDIIDVALFISGCKYAKSANGIIDYSEGLEFVGAEALGWNIGIDDKKGELAFFAYPEKGSPNEKAFKLIVNLKFRVTAEAGDEVSLSSESITVPFNNGCKNVRFETKKISVSEPSYGDFDIRISNAYSFKFDPNEFEYDVTIPYNSAMPDISITRNEGQSYSISDLVIPDSGTGTVVVRIDQKDGKSQFYTINVKRDKQPDFDINCRLGALEIEGFRLDPSFSPEITEYSITVPYGTEKINIYCVAQNATAQVFISDTTLYETENFITVSVVAPDGETLVYTITVTVLPQDDIDNGITENQSERTAAILITAISVLFMFGILIVIDKKKIKKQ